MRRMEVLHGLRRTKFESVLDRWGHRELNLAEAAEALGMSERSFQRW